MFEFKKFTKDEQRKIDEKQKEIDVATKATEEALRACQTSDTFRTYREELEKSDKALVEHGILILRTVKDSKERVIAYDALFERAEILGLLLKQVTDDQG